MLVEILGPGCKNCQTLEARTREALSALGVEADVREVTDVAEIAGRGVLRTPGLAIDGEVVVSGRVPTVPRLQELLTGSR
jgi:small redox-active disulfide protein 2